jgi:phosphoglycerate kinase
MGLLESLGRPRWICRQEALMNIKTLEAIDVRGKRVLLRCDLNVPLTNGVISDDGRIRASLPTIKYLLAQGASIVITAHLGRPKGERASVHSRWPRSPFDLQSYLKFQ